MTADVPTTALVLLALLGLAWWCIPKGKG